MADDPVTRLLQAEEFTKLARDSDGSTRRAWAELAQDALDEFRLLVEIEKFKDLIREKWGWLEVHVQRRSGPIMFS